MKRFLMVSAVTVSAWCVSAQATVQLEFDFQNYDAANHQVQAAQTRAGASHLGQLLSSDGTTTGAYATANTGAAVGTSQVAAALRNGYLNVVGSDMRGLIMKESATGLQDSWWNDYTGRYDFSSGTVQIVYKPYDSGLNAGARRVYFSHSGGSTSDGLSFQREGNVVQVTVGTSTVSVAGPSWETDTWYFLSISWQNGNVPRVYWRELYDETDQVLDPGATGHFAAGGVNIVSGSGFGQRAPALGVLARAASTPNYSMNGQMAYFRWTDEYTTSAAGFDQLFGSLLVPEPASLGLVVAGVVAAAGQRRRSSRGVSRRS